VGILRGSARLLLDEARRRPFEGAVLELGKMFVFFTRQELARWAQMHRVPLADVADVGLSHDPALAAQGCLDDRSFFSLLGFARVTSCDASRWEGADILLDLNQPAPEELRGRFDVVFEGGTIQHVFHLPRVLQNVHHFLKPGGRVIHGMSPSNNHVDHGFYMYSPTLFYDFYSANRFEINTFYLFDFALAYYVRARLETTRWRIYRYQPGCLDDLSYGRFGNRQAGIFVVATKTEDSTGDAIPQQGFYRDLWRRTGEREPPDPVASAAPEGAEPAGAAMSLLRAWKRCREVTRRWGPKRLPPVVARY
jgi:SAM-dependent methyltransferase